jgi:hypothetical protein
MVHCGEKSEKCPAAAVFSGTPDVSGTAQGLSQATCRVGETFDRGRSDMSRPIRRHGQTSRQANSLGRATRAGSLVSSAYPPRSGLATGNGIPGVSEARQSLPYSRGSCEMRYEPPALAPLSPREHVETSRGQNRAFCGPAKFAKESS